MGLYDSNKKADSSPKMNLPIKKIAIAVVSLAVLGGGGYFGYLKIKEYQREEAIKVAEKEKVPSFSDDELIADVDAKGAYRGVRAAFVFNLGQLAVLRNKYDLEMTLDEKESIEKLLKKHAPSTKQFDTDFSRGIEEGVFQIEPKIIQDGVEKSLGKKSIVEARKSLAWLLKQVDNQEKTLLELRFDLKNNPNKAIDELKKMQGD